MRSLRRVSLTAAALISLVILASCEGSKDAPADDSTEGTLEGYAPGYKKGTCASGLSMSPLIAEAECGTFFVAETAETDAALLSVMRLRTASPSRKDDPVVFIAGGPGQSATEIVRGFFGYPPFSQLFFERDIIALDLRGTGDARPSMACPERREPILSDKQLSQGQGDAGYKACRDRLAQQLKHGLGQFGSSLDAQDVTAVVGALGAQTWNVYAVSSGTRVGQELLRTRPAGLRSVILDSVVPRGVASIFDAETQTAAVLPRIFQACSEESSCSGAFGDIAAKLTSVLQKLEATPRSLNVAGVTVTMDDSTAVEILRALLTSHEGARWVPLFVQTLSTGGPQAVDLIKRLPDAELSQALGLYMSVVCRESARPTAQHAGGDALVAQIGKSSYSAKALDRLCPLWGVAYESGADAPLASDIPTLVLAGGNDPIIPMAWSTQLAPQLSHGQVLTLTGEGHTPGTTACGAIAVSRFMGSPGTAVSLPCASLAQPYRFVTAP